MKKLICLIPVMIIILMLSQDVKTYATTIDNYNVVIIFREGRDYKIAAFDSLTITRQESQGEVYYYEGNFRGYSQSRSSFSSIGDAIAYIPNIEYFYAYGSPYSFQSPVIVVKGIVVNNTGLDNDTFFDSIQDYEDYINPPTPTPEPSVWDEMWDTYYAYFGRYPDDDSLWGYLRKWFDDPEEESGTYTDSIIYPSLTPSPTPTPFPTQIPYSTQIIPVTNPSTGEITYQYTYIYHDDNGNTLTATAPPPQPTCIPPQSGGNISEPVNQNPIAVPTNQLQAFYQFAYDTNEFPNPEEQDPKADLEDSMKVMNEGIQEYDDAISVLSAAMNCLPDEWLWIFGICAGIIFMAGIISRFLGG